MGVLRLSIVCCTLYEDRAKPPCSDAFQLICAGTVSQVASRVTFGKH